MKIAFWSNVRGQCGTTLHLTSIAIIQAMFDKKKVVLMENHDHLLNIESCLVKKGRSDMVMESPGIYNRYGLENLLASIDSAAPKVREKLIKKCSMRFAYDRLYYLPHSYLKNRDILDYQFDKKLNGLLKNLETYFYAVYIDTFAAESMSTKNILDSADVVVVNLNQNSNVINHFFSNFSSLRSKAVFLLGNYYPCRYNSIYEIRRRYQIPENRIYAIPFCMEAAEAESEGSLASFIGRNYLEPSISNRDFISSIYNAYKGIMDYSAASKGPGV